MLKLFYLRIKMPSDHQSGEDGREDTSESTPLPKTKTPTKGVCHNITLKKK